MVKVGLFVRLHAKPGKETELSQLLKGAQALAQEEPETATWYAVQFDRSTFGIFDTFAAESGRQAHLSGRIAQSPNIEKIDVLAAKG
jgi:hypothetical protein